MSSSTHPAFTQLNSWNLPDYDGTGVLFRHEKSGAQVFHLRNNDPENLFAFSFATLPEDSTGVAHILEHTVLSGSQRFPVKDPFLQLLKGSVNTFLNAMTFPDKTVYPAASPVAADLFNMMKVYGDAVFFPLLKRELFRQEGHRLQFRTGNGGARAANGGARAANAGASGGALERTGIVYNEMKGNYSSHDSVVSEKCLQSLFPDILYRHDSGGDPAVIPRLTYEQFVAFHRRYYHPANARIVLYGDIPTKEYLAFLDREFLSRFGEGEVASPIPGQPRWSEPRRIETTYPLDGVDDLSRRSSVTVNWLLFPVTAHRRLLAFSVLAEILVGHSGAPLTKALIDSGLGQDVSPLYGLEADVREAVFSAGLRGTDPESADAVEKVIFDTLSHLSFAGIPEDLVEGALRRVEFHNRELKSGPNGMRVMQRVLRTWMYGADPTEALNFNDDMAALRGRVEAVPRFFEELIDELLLQNTHRSTVIVKPDPQQSKREEAALQRELDELARRLTTEDRRRIESESEALRQLQETPDDPEALAAIPFLHLEDIPREARTIRCEVAAVGGAAKRGGAVNPDDGANPGGAAAVPVYRHNEFTNGIVYLELAFDFGELSPRQESLLNLLGAAFTETGLPDVPFDALNHEINLKTGGITALIGQQTRYADLSLVRRLFVIRLRVLERSLGEGLDLLARILSEVDFSDTLRVRQLVDELREEIRSSWIPGGHYFAGLRAGSAVHGLSRLEEEMNGITQVEYLDGFARELAEAESDVAGGPDAGGANVGGTGRDRVTADMEQLFRTLIDPATLSVNVTGTEDAISTVEDWIPSVVTVLDQRALRPPAAGTGVQADAPGAQAGAPGSQAGIVPSPASDRPRIEYLLGSSTVAYVAAAFPSLRHGDPLAPAQDLLAHILRTGLLWEKIRMKGGAYGAFAGSRTAEGYFSFSSYRDPHSAVTIEAFRDALAELAGAPLPTEALSLAKVSMLGRELRPLTPRDAGYVDFRRRLHDITDELRQELRDRLRAVTPEDIRKVAALLLEKFDQRYIAVLGGKAGLDELEALDGTEVTVRELGV